VSDQFYKRFILGLLFTQGCESETYDVLDSTPKECRIMRCKYFSSMNPTYGMEKRFNFLQQKHPIPKCNFLNAIYYTTQKKEHNYLLYLILKESKCKSFNASLLSIKMKESDADTKDTKKKYFKQRMHSKDNEN
jgi:hypothetical protein